MRDTPSHYALSFCGVFFFFVFLFAAVFFKLWVGHGLLRTDRRMQYARYKTDKGIRKGMNDAAKTYKKRQNYPKDREAKLHLVSYRYDKSVLDFEKFKKGGYENGPVPAYNQVPILFV